ncbi:UvrD-like helicase ATP-binding domain-containing protein [Mycena kentingensis (nom. inval.)]|nr:UvrD-like helicase ATP-binding domain-containing protein [Mycena kentingensis (nom. inval.)]
MAQLAFQFDRIPAVSYLLRSAFLNNPQIPDIYLKASSHAPGFVVFEFLHAAVDRDELVVLWGHLLTASAPPPRASRSKNELEAAGKLQKALLRALDRGKRRSTSTQSSSALRHAPPAVIEQFLVFFTLVPMVKGADDSDRLYTRRARGPLPHLLVALNAAHDQAQTEKKQMLLEYQKLQHQGLERFDERLTAVQTTLKKVIELEKVLGPTDKNGIHARRDHKVLEDSTKDAVNLLRNLPFVCPTGVHLGAHLKIAEAAILGIGERPPKRKTPKKSLKPALNMPGEWCEDE